METCIGHIETVQDALYIFEACRKGLLNRVQHRLSNKERLSIDSGSIFVWDEQEAGVRRWTDGRIWSPSYILGNFLTYRELDKSSKLHGQKQCLYKQNGLIKQSFSIVTNTYRKLHLISYYKKRDVLSGKLKRPTDLFQLDIPRGIYSDLMQSIVKRHDSFHSSTTASRKHTTITTSFTDQQYSIKPDYTFTLNHAKHKKLSTQDIAWNKLQSTEDIRQLNVLKLNI